jgi:glycosyltransferase involved in cell wall biosynthesis
MVEPYPFGQFCGNIKFQAYILNHVDKKKFKLYLAVPFASEFTEKFSKEGFEVLVVPPHKRLLQYAGSWAKDNIVGRLLTALSIIPYNLKLWSLIKKNKIDVIYCNCIRSLLYIFMAAKITSTPLLWYVKGELVNNMCDRLGFIFADKIIFFCKSNKYDKYLKFVDFFDRKIEILAPGLDPQEIMDAENIDKTNLKRELSLNENKVNIVTVGRLCPLKGVHYLLEALEMIIPRHPHVMLYIVGDPVIDEYRNYQNELWKIIKRNKLEANVKFTGWRTDAMAITALMDILVHPSLSEGFCLAVLEGMALGKPVVASRLGGLREAIIDGENGFLVAPGDVRSFAEKISILIDNKKLRESLGQAARKKIFAEYLLKDKISQLERIWTEMASIT